MYEKALLLICATVYLRKVKKKKKEKKGKKRFLIYTITRKNLVIYNHILGIISFFFLTFAII